MGVLCKQTASNENSSAWLLERTGKSIAARAILKEPRHGFARLENFSLNFSRSSFVIRDNLLHPQPSLLLDGLLLSL